MTELQLESLRDKYNGLLTIKNEILTLQEEKEKLEKNYDVMRYLEIINKLESNKGYSFYGVEKLNNDQILEKAIGKLDFSSSNGIYVYMGSFKVNQKRNEFDPFDISVPYNSTDEDYKLYRNIELKQWDEGYELRIFIDEQAEFEKNNTILYPSYDIDNNRYYRDVRKMYFKEAVLHDENRAYAKILDLSYRDSKR